MASISDRVEDLGEYLREQRESARLSVRQLATLTGISNPYLSQVERGLRKPSAEVLQQIAKGLRISAEVLYVRAGILDHEGRPDVEAAVAADPFLNDRQRRVLLDIYASFRAENARAEAEPVQQAPAPRRVAVKRVAAKRTSSSSRRASSPTPDESGDATSTPTASARRSARKAGAPARTTKRSARKAAAPSEAPAESPTDAETRLGSGEE